MKRTLTVCRNLPSVALRSGVKREGRCRRWGRFQIASGSETAEQALQRRLRESQRVEERVVQVNDRSTFAAQVLQV